MTRIDLVSNPEYFLDENLNILQLPTVCAQCRVPRRHTELELRLRTKLIRTKIPKRLESLISFPRRQKISHSHRTRDQVTAVALDYIQASLCSSENSSSRAPENFVVSLLTTPTNMPGVTVKYVKIVTEASEALSREQNIEVLKPSLRSRPS